MKPFQKETVFGQDNLFYSTHDPQTLISAIEAVLSDMDIKAEKNAKKFKLTYEAYQDQTEEEAKLELPCKGVRMQVKVTEVD